MLVAVAILNGRTSRTAVIGKVVRVDSAVSLVDVMGLSMAGRRGPVFGILAFLVYGSVLGVSALSYPRLRRWSDSWPSCPSRSLRSC